MRLETRVPPLDHRAREVAPRFLVAPKIRHCKGKMILHKLLYREHPEELSERSTMGFGIPAGESSEVRCPSAPRSCSLPAYSAAGFVDALPIRRWGEHLASSVDATKSLWPVLMFHPDLPMPVAAATQPERTPVGG